jgi:hypothetical protein
MELNLASVSKMARLTPSPDSLRRSPSPLSIRGTMICTASEFTQPIANYFAKFQTSSVYHIQVRACLLNVPFTLILRCVG